MRTFLLPFSAIGSPPSPFSLSAWLVKAKDHVLDARVTLQFSAHFRAFTN